MYLSFLLVSLPCCCPAVILAMVMIMARGTLMFPKHLNNQNLLTTINPLTNS